MTPEDIEAKIVAESLACRDDFEAFIGSMLKKYPPLGVAIALAGSLATAFGAMLETNIMGADEYDRIMLSIERKAKPPPIVRQDGTTNDGEFKQQVIDCLNPLAVLAKSLEKRYDHNVVVNAAASLAASMLYEAAKHGATKEFITGTTDTIKRQALNAMPKMNS